MRDMKIGLLLLSQAEEGNVDAMVNWASWRCVLNSDFPLTNDEIKRVIEYYTAGMMAEIPVAFSNLGKMYYDGEYVEQNYEKALELFTKAADLGDTRAACKLGNCYYSGEHCNLDLEKAFKFFVSAALIDSNCEAFCMLGDMYLNGQFVDKHEDTAYALYCKAEENITEDDSDVVKSNIYMRVGECKLNGIGCNIDLFEALEKLTKAQKMCYREFAVKNDNTQAKFDKIEALIFETKAVLNEKLGVVSNDDVLM